MAKKISKGQMAGYVILGSILLLLLVFMAIGGKQQKKNFEVHLTENENSVYKTKLEAYKASNKGSNGNMNIIEYEEIVATTNNSGETNTQKNDHAEVDQTAQYIANAQKDLKRQNSQATSVNKISDSDYSEIESKIKSSYGNKATKDDAKPTLSEKERRKQAMEQSWGNVSSSANNNNSSSGGSYKGVVHGSQTVISGQSATFRTTQEITTHSGIIIPKNTLITGRAMLNQNRLNVSISSVRVGNEIIPVTLSVYGSDGVLGIPVDVDVSAEAASKEGRGEAIDEAGSVVKGSGIGGRIVNSVTKVATSAAKAAKRETEQEIKLIDNQMIVFRLN